jgi:uncharacterized membrane protein
MTSPPPPTRLVRRTILLCVLAASGQVGLVLAMTDGNAGVAADVPLLLFLAGPLLYLALLAWRRRDHPGRSRSLLRATLGVAVCGLLALGLHCYRFHTDPAVRGGLNLVPRLVPLAQWVVVVAVWLSLVRAEAAEKALAGRSVSKDGPLQHPPGPSR